MCVIGLWDAQTSSNYTYVSSFYVALMDYLYSILDSISIRRDEYKIWMYQCIMYPLGCEIDDVLHSRHDTEPTPTLMVSPYQFSRTIRRGIAAQFFLKCGSYCKCIKKTTWMLMQERREVSNHRRTPSGRKGWREHCWKNLPWKLL